MFLNYHHLRYFWAIVQEGGLGKAAARLHVSQSALSIQLRQLEESLGHALFTRRNRRLTLTEAGHVTLQYANTIFRAERNCSTRCSTVGERRGRLCAWARWRRCRAISNGSF
jgi:DNA-binding transcriptional LysR family regulator